MSKRIFTAFFVGLIIGSVSLTYATWSAPTATPPNGNTPAPINVSSLAQDKLGVLTVGGLGVFGPTLITSSGGYTLPSTLQLGVNGKVGATAYCDQNGNNCVSTLGGGSYVNNTTSGSSGKAIVCGGWDEKYPGNTAVNTWGCGSTGACPAGYSNIKTSNPTVNNVEQTHLCILSSI